MHLYLMLYTFLKEYVIIVWYDFLCNSGCAAGWYGSGCIQKCRGHCKHSVPCNHVSGLCDNGCSDEWKGTFCEIEKGIF